MNPFLRSLLLMTLLLLIPVAPFLAFGSEVEAWIERWTTQPMAPVWVAASVILLLSTDIFLPVPSSLISTLGGTQLGWLGGTLASWAGMSLGAALGFSLARAWGRPVAVRLSSEEALERVALLSQRVGPFLLVLTRGVPLLAEASVLALGIHRLPWSRFLPAVLLSNLGIAFAYSAFGHVAQQNQWLPLALGVSIALPVVSAMAAKLWWPAERK